MSEPLRPVRSLLVAACLLGLSALAGCLQESDAVPSFGGPELYPHSVGTYSVFAVADTTWHFNVPTINTYQLREVVTDSFPSAAASGQAATYSYRVVRSRRENSAADWKEDSVFTLTSLPQALLLSRSNRRTVELLFPIRKGLVWNRLSYDGQDSIDRAYRRVGEPVTLRLPDGQTKTYEQSVRTSDLDEENALYHRTYEQIYVSNVGPVQRRRRNLNTYNLVGTEQVPNPDYIFEGSTHREVLMEHGKLK